jgi:hypothetical protein
MKTLSNLMLLPATAGLLFLSSCKEEKKTEVELPAVPLSENKHEMRMYQMRDSLIQTFDQTLAEINKDLVQLNSKQGVLVDATGDKEADNRTMKESILRNIQIVNLLAEENKKKINNLVAELKQYRMENTTLYTLLEEDAKKIDRYVRQLDSMKSELAFKEYTADELNRKVDDLKIRNELLGVEAERYRTNLSTGYYICEDKKVLRKQGILVQKGGVLGLGKTTMLDPAVSENNFTKIDIHKNTSIPISGDKPQLVTEHPEGSYEFKKENNMKTYLHIQDPDRFWKTSKYMVVAVR